MSNIVVSDIDAKVQLRLRNIVNSPLSQATRYSAYNDVIDFLQGISNWETTERIGTFLYLNRESDYSLANNVGITDFKQYKNLRFVTQNIIRNIKEFEEIEPNKLTIALGQSRYNNELCFESRDNDVILRILSDFGQGDSIVDDTGDLTTGRTWSADTANSCALNLTSDTTRIKAGGGSLMFDIDPNQSVNQFARIYTSVPFAQPIDGSSVINFGFFRFWEGLHNLSAANLALIQSVTFVWGSDGAGTTPLTKANYWNQTVTTSATGGGFKATWNRESFNWALATKVGSPNAGSLSYFEVQVNFGAGFTLSQNIRIDQIKMFNPVEMELVYFSQNFVLSGTTLQPHLTTTIPNPTEQILLPQTHIKTFINLSLKELWPQKQRDNEGYTRAMAELKEDLPMAIDMSGESITREEREFQVDGDSTGRMDMQTNQW